MVLFTGNVQNRHIYRERMCISVCLELESDRGGKEKGEPLLGGMRFLFRAMRMFYNCAVCPIPRVFEKSLYWTLYT